MSIHAPVRSTKARPAPLAGRRAARLEAEMVATRKRLAPLHAMRGAKVTRDPLLHGDGDYEISQNLSEAAAHAITEVMLADAGMRGYGPVTEMSL